MMEGLRQWIVSLTALCMLLALARVLVPGGTMSRVAAFVGGLVLLAALARPLSELGAVRLALRTMPARSNGCSGSWKKRTKRRWLMA